MTFSLQAKEEHMDVNRLHPGKSMYTFEVPQATDYGVRGSQLSALVPLYYVIALTRLCYATQTGGYEK